MAKLIFAMNLSLDGYVDGMDGKLDMPPGTPELFDYWIEHVRGVAGSVYGRRMYEVMRYWDTEDPDWTPQRRAFGEAWRRLPKWVVSRTLKTVGPNATLIAGDIEEEVRAIKARIEGTLTVSGPQLAGLMTQLGLIDEYHMYLRPFVLGQGKAFFHGARPPLRLVSSTQIDAETIHLAYVPA